MRALDNYLQKRKGASAVSSGTETFKGVADMESDEENWN